MTRSLFRLVVGLPLLALLLTAAVDPGRANVIGIETYMGHGDLAYSGDLKIQGRAGVVQGKVYRMPGKQRTDFTVKGTPFGALVDLASGTGTLWSPVFRSYASTPLDRFDVRDWVPQLENHSQVAIVPAEGEGSMQEVNGVLATRYALSGISPEGTPYEGQLWASEEGIILRVVARIATIDGPVTYNLTNLEIAPQPPGLFSPPEGYQQRSWAEAAGLLGF